MKMRPIPMPKASEQPARPKKIKNEGEKQSPNSFNDKLEGSRKVNADTKENLKSEKVSKDDVKKDVAVNPKAKGLQDASEIKPNLNPQITKLLGKDSKVQIAKKLDKDSLNQSIAGSQFIQNEEAVKEVSLKDVSVKDVSVKEVSVNNDKI
ncbi:MAG: hypothetical protein B6229_10435 [Spirochaetaceae bacterium 4572_7]|nr:MAG: hypothetical protein B6229_10435 [Spirochaetaceae bacterium 4572_7]